MTTNETIHPTRQHFQERMGKGIAPNEPHHVIAAVFDPEDATGFVYTYGVASATPSTKFEFICLACSRDNAFKASIAINVLAQRLVDGHDVCDANEIMTSCCDMQWSVLQVPDHINALLLETHATACDDDTKLLLVMPSDQLPLTLTFSTSTDKDSVTLLVAEEGPDGRSFYAPAA